MLRRTALKLPLLATAVASLSPVPLASAAPARWSVDRANRWYQAQGWLVGANYITSNAVNQLEMFQQDTYDPRRIDAELRVARLIGFNTVRVFLHDLLWAQDRKGFQRRLAQFVDIAARHGIKPLFVLVRLVLGPAAEAWAQHEPPTPGCTTPAGCRAPVPSVSTIAATAACCTTIVDGVMSQFRNDHRVSWAGTCGTNRTIPQSDTARSSGRTSWTWSRICFRRCSGGRARSIRFSR